MRVTRLHARGLRRFTEVSLLPAPGINLITGDNGAGKTSLLEALHLMAYARSFRGRVRDGLVQAGAPALEVFVEWQEGHDGSQAAASTNRLRKAGLRHTGQEWSGRLDGSPLKQIGELCAALAVVSFEPGSHALITGAAELRRRFLDWGLFHVEHDFMAQWRRYARALKQRNALLKSRSNDEAQLDSWDCEIAETGEWLDSQRQRYLDALQPYFADLLMEWAPVLGDVQLQYHPGWRRDEVSLADALLLARSRDLLLGYSTVGPHRADWRINFSGLPGREALSRGQSKLVALAALLAQGEHLALLRGEWPVVALDDLASELDQTHQRRVIQRLGESGAQIFVTGTEAPQALTGRDFTLFHVEHGEVLQHMASPDAR